ncbi:SDR family oxidoreductase [Motiliproteus sp. MSK22-1]|uniref:SDR family oxidoreductase n=1 Tax=Motiliproteus sp. MSK22-1 TaxID=1897630 RepID=UPI000979F91E|nr:SDR family oxidoreductase [Motiliproteus sp. MSK22-1]OMH25979.1 NAD(P)-dependent oxidoreductase [Motiliproteus sp. MSK22-1]
MLITGASRGIGAATAKLAAADGYSVAINYCHNSQAAERVVQEIVGAGGKAIALPGDVSQEGDVIAMFEQLDQQLGAITHLVNNAGILARQARLEEMDSERLNRVFSINVTGSFLCAREAAKRMSKRHGGEGGAIVNLSSIAARLGAPDEYVDYAASKGAIDAMTIGLAKELAEEGIRVNAVRPGIIYTDIHASGGEPGRVDRLKSSVPMKRGGESEEVAQAILWLLSDQASYTTGSFIDVSGGRI